MKQNRYPRPENIDQLINPDTLYMMKWWLGKKISKGMYRLVVKAFGSGKDAIQDFCCEICRGVPSIVEGDGRSIVKKFHWHLLRGIDAMKQHKRAVLLFTELETDLDISLNDFPAAEPHRIEPDVRQMIDNSLRFITKKNRTIIDLRFGLSDGHEYDNFAIGRMLRMTGERVRQMQLSAFEVISPKLQCLSDSRPIERKQIKLKMKCSVCQKAFEHKHKLKFCSQECKDSVKKSSVASRIDNR